MSETALDPLSCPLCGQDNACGIAAGKRDCWCFAVGIAPEVIARVPLEAQGACCVCAACASGKRHPALVSLAIDTLLRGRK